MNEKIFDEIAGRYDDVLNQGLAASGETREYFAEKRLILLKKLIQKNKVPSPLSILDYGCGTGSASPILRELFPDATLVGTDVSTASLEVARKNYSSLDTIFLPPAEIGPRSFDLIFCNGVFHHIEPPARPPVLGFIREHLNAHGLFAFFENNPWNPGTRHIMKNCPFDSDAKVISPSKAVRLLESQGFEWITLQTLFYFPRWLGLLRFTEGFLGRFPLGAQYLVLTRVATVFHT